ncbi:hypothetical protein F5Y06DRAFT_302144 [Hypoxylon sp. FL0890]|nr:hypothetical protein F5Y06DRAFT_302144 [Hypoxylon sp. FL0890]
MKESKQQYALQNELSFLHAQYFYNIPPDLGRVTKPNNRDSSKMVPRPTTPVMCGSAYFNAATSGRDKVEAIYAWLKDVEEPEVDMKESSPRVPEKSRLRGKNSKDSSGAPPRIPQKSPLRGLRLKTDKKG